MTRPAAALAAILAALAASPAFAQPPTPAQARAEGEATRLDERCARIGSDDSLRRFLAFEDRIKPLPPRARDALLDAYQGGKDKAADALTRNRAKACAAPVLIPLAPAAQPASAGARPQADPFPPSRAQLPAGEADLLDYNDGLAVSLAHACGAITSDEHTSVLAAWRAFFHNLPSPTPTGSARMGWWMAETHVTNALASRGADTCQDLTVRLVQRAKTLAALASQQADAPGRNLPGATPVPPGRDIEAARRRLDEALRQAP